MAPQDSQPFVGEPLPIDLLNTQWEDQGRRYDALTSDDGVRSFLASHGEDPATLTLAMAGAALAATRETIHELLETPEESEVIKRTNSLLSNANVVLVNRSDDAGPRVEITGDEPLTTLRIKAVIEAVELLRTRPDRIRTCDHDECVRWFFDASKAGRRRWCSMERCGNRAKSKRHYERHKNST